MSTKPTTNDRKQWTTYWAKQGEFWRTEPEIDVERQAFLRAQQAIQPNYNEEIYSFTNIRLTRADVEWLMHEHGPIDWSDEKQRQRRGLDLRGALLGKTDTENAIYLGRLPLAKTDLSFAHMEGTDLGADYDDLITGFPLEDIDPLTWSGSLYTIEGVHLEGAYLISTNLEGARLDGAHLEGASLRSANLKGAILISASLDDADLNNAHLEGASLRSANLKGTNLTSAHLEYADLSDAHLKGASLCSANLEGATIDGISLNSKTKMVGIKFKDVDLTGVKWQRMPRFCDDPFWIWQQRGVVAVVRTYRQLATTLRNQGMADEADTYAYRAQVAQRGVLIRSLRLPAYLFSHLLNLVAGYGYKPERSLIAYILIILTFAFTYHQLGTGATTLNWQESIVISMTAFHGRGFFATAFQPGDPQALAAAIEAFTGLIIEVSFIATFTQRFFGK